MDGQSLSSWLTDWDPRIGFGSQNEYVWSISFEMREAARFAGIPWLDYKAMPVKERAATVAHRRARNMLDRVQQRKSEMKKR